MGDLGCQSLSESNEAHSLLTCLIDFMVLSHDELSVEANLIYVQKVEK